MATLPPYPYAPDPERTPDGAEIPTDHSETLPGPDDPEAPAIALGDPGDAPSDSPAAP